VFYGGGGTDQYPVIDRDACSVPIGSRGVRSFLGPRVPDYTHIEFNVRGGFYFNLPPAPGSASRADFARAALESVGYGIRANVERVAAITGVPVKDLAVCGGLSKSLAVREVLPNVLNMPVKVAEQKEGSAMGAALCAAVGSGRMPSFQDAARDMVRLEVMLEPEPEKVALYEALYQEWRSSVLEVHGASHMGELE
jgi:autoinducer-2 kinase